MREIVATQMRESSQVFNEIVWPAMLDKIGGGEIICVEDWSNDQGVKELDYLAGIDAWQIMPDKKGMRGIAQRAQKNANYKSFTLRYKTGFGSFDTEYHKRLHAINSDRGMLYPHVTMQAYYDSTGLLSCGAIRTRDLLNYVENNLGNTCMIRTNKDDGAQFVTVFWKDLTSDGVEVLQA